ncbi:MAG: hypothetical protein KC964_05635 [Candidatus Omnitrophica bacterium]|nr:hypothetical protein [Candidatus Omnitrophota bacterium]
MENSKGQLTVEEIRHAFQIFKYEVWLLATSTTMRDGVPSVCYAISKDSNAPVEDVMNSWGNWMNEISSKILLLHAGNLNWFFSKVSKAVRVGNQIYAIDFDFFSDPENILGESNQRWITDLANPMSLERKVADRAQIEAFQYIQFKALLPLLIKSHKFLIDAREQMPDKEMHDEEFCHMGTDAVVDIVSMAIVRRMHFS